ncbi:hypothetical protein HDU93_009819 [Gonapodya sp. JEL0774]|nr:hypothetical protein HDU93_009819 [Gonapodya sp. JEL0774]
MSDKPRLPSLTLRMLLSADTLDVSTTLRYLESVLISEVPLSRSQRENQISLLQSLVDEFSSVGESSPLPEPLSSLPFLDLVHLVVPLALSSIHTLTRDIAVKFLQDVMASKGNAREVMMGCVERWDLVELDATTAPREWIMIAGMVVRVLPRIRTAKLSNFAMETLPGIGKGISIIKSILGRLVTDDNKTSQVVPRIEFTATEAGNNEDSADGENAAPDDAEHVPSINDAYEIFTLIASYLECLWNLIKTNLTISLRHPPDVTTDPNRTHVLLSYIFFQTVDTLSYLDLDLDFAATLNTSTRHLRAPRPANGFTQPPSVSPHPDWWTLVERLLTLAREAQLEVMAVLRFHEEVEAHRGGVSLPTSDLDNKREDIDDSIGAKFAQLYPATTAVGVFVGLVMESEERTRRKSRTASSSPFLSSLVVPKLANKRYLFARLIGCAVALMEAGCSDQAAHAGLHAIALLSRIAPFVPRSSISPATFSSADEYFPAPTVPYHIFYSLVRLMITTALPLVRSSAFQLVRTLTSTWLDEECRMRWIAEMLKMGGFERDEADAPRASTLGLTGMGVAAVTLLKQEIVSALEGAEIISDHAGRRSQRTFFPIIFNIKDTLYTMSGTKVLKRGEKFAGPYTVMSDDEAFFEKHGLLMQVLNVYLYLLIRDRANKTHVWNEASLDEIRYRYLDPLSKRVGEMKRGISESPAGLENAGRELEVVLIENVLKRVDEVERQGRQERGVGLADLRPPSSCITSCAPQASDPPELRSHRAPFSMRSFLTATLALSLLHVVLATVANHQLPITLHSHLRRFDDHALIRLFPRTPAHHTILQHWLDNGVDFWSHPRMTEEMGTVVDVRMTLEQRTRFAEQLEDMDGVIIVEDIQKLVDAEREEVLLASGAGKSFLTSYHPYDDIVEYLNALVARHPDLVTMTEIGKTYEGRTIWGVRLARTADTFTPTRVAKMKGKNPTPHDPPRATPQPDTSTSGHPPLGFVFHGGQHAREWISTAVSLYMLDALATVLATPTLDSPQDRALAQFEWTVVPVLNVDGYVYTWQKDRMWRKNRQPNHGSSIFPCVGTDTNRNWDYRWNTGGSSHNPCSEAYLGPSPFSAPEPKAIADYVLGRKAAGVDVRAYIDFHAYSQLWMSPWGYTCEGDPRDEARQIRAAGEAVKAVQGVNGKKFTAGTICRTIYPASGSSTDYMYGVANVTYSYGVELRDTGAHGFVLPASEIDPSGKETWAGVRKVADHPGRPPITLTYLERPTVVTHAEVAVPAEPGVPVPLDEAVCLFEDEVDGLGDDGGGVDGGQGVVETGSKNHEVVPTSIISSIAQLRHGGAHKILADLARDRLVGKVQSTNYDGYRLTYAGYDYLALRTFAKRGSVYSLGNQIGVGKESEHHPHMGTLMALKIRSPRTSFPHHMPPRTLLPPPPFPDVYIVSDEQGNQRVLKLQRLGRTSFRTVRTNRDYLSPRGRGRVHRTPNNGQWLYLSRLAAMKEYAFMKVLHEHGFPVPKPIDANRHCVVMELVDGELLSHVHHLTDPGLLYSKLMDLIVRLARHGLVHGDFNEFNILITRDDQPVIIDFPQMVSTEHGNVEMYFNRDVECLRDFFRRRFHYESALYPVFSRDGERKFNLDVAVAASGFSRKHDKEMRELREIQEGKDAGDGDGSGEEDDEGDEEDEEEEEEEEEAVAETGADGRQADRPDDASTLSDTLADLAISPAPVHATAAPAEAPSPITPDPPTDAASDRSSSHSPSDSDDDAASLTPNTNAQSRPFRDRPTPTTPTTQVVLDPSGRPDRHDPIEIRRQLAAEEAKRRGTNKTKHNMASRSGNKGKGRKVKSGVVVAGWE